MKKLTIFLFTVLLSPLGVHAAFAPPSDETLGQVLAGSQSLVTVIDHATPAEAAQVLKRLLEMVQASNVPAESKTHLIGLFSAQAAQALMNGAPAFTRELLGLVSADLRPAIVAGVGLGLASDLAILAMVKAALTEYADLLKFLADPQLVLPPKASLLIQAALQAQSVDAAQVLPYVAAFYKGQN